MNTFLYGAVRYQVVAPVVVVGVGARQEHINRNGLLPIDAPLDQIEHLLELGMIREFGGVK